MFHLTASLETTYSLHVLSTGHVSLIQEETITATLGHRFWVTGAGWRMAKFLEPGERLFCPRGSIGLRSAAAAEQDLAYNLVVGDYHTYFVGESRLLVHDHSCPQPTTTALPGVSEQVASR